MGDYRGVSELQDTSARSPRQPRPRRRTGGPPAPPAQPPVKPVIRAAAAKRANASVIGMFIALVLSIAAFLPIVLMNPSPKTDGYRPDINVSAVAQNAADVAGFTPAAPDTGDTFRPNYARWESGAGSGVPTWEVGYLTPKESFIGLVQTAAVQSHLAAAADQERSRDRNPERRRTWTGNCATPARARSPWCWCTAAPPSS